jgi:GNAT superfamily N-acetyltransferase
MPDDLLIRRFDFETDSVSDLTALLHRAYAGLAERGLRFVATWQGDEITRDRLESGEGFVAVLEGRIVGTVTLSRPRATDAESFYSRPGVAYLNQLAVEPELQGQGIGHRLMDFAEDWARGIGAEELALDTAADADHLIAWYARLGYREVDRENWIMTNYESVILSKRIATSGTSRKRDVPES